VSDSVHVAPPSPALLALEGRAWLEFAALVPALPLLARAPRGDGHPVLVLPGWLASDRSTWALRRFLRDRGYHVHGWRLGRNLGPNADTVAGLARRFATLRERHGKKLSLIGWSLGGIYARELGRRFPGEVRQVITLASPFRAPSATSVSRFYRARRSEARPDLRQRLGEPLPVPSTSLYSRSDGVVAWRSCIQDEGPLAENIEVRTSHCGMGHHPGVLLVIADRLAQPENAWQRYEPPGVVWRAALGVAG
jgi:pimeloyl-ACP methyl ester carboxylesterase